MCTIKVKQLICKMFIWIIIVLHINEVWPEQCPTYKRGPSSEITCDHEGRNLSLLMETLYFPHSLSLTLHLLIRSYAAEMTPRHLSFKHHYHNLLFCPFQGEVSLRLKLTAEALRGYLKFIALKWLHRLPLLRFNEYMIESVYNSVNHSVSQSVVLSVNWVCLEDHLMHSWGVQFFLPLAKISQSISKVKTWVIIFLIPIIYRCLKAVTFAVKSCLKL